MGRKSRAKRDRPPSNPRAIPAPRGWTAPLAGGALILLLTAGRMWVRDGSLRHPNAPRVLCAAAVAGMIAGLSLSLVAVPLARRGARGRLLGGVAVMGAYFAAVIGAAALSGEPVFAPGDTLAWIVFGSMAIGYGFLAARHLLDDAPAPAPPESGDGRPRGPVRSVRRAAGSARHEPWDRREVP